MFDSYHDKNFDGIVIKLPSPIIDLNELQPLLEKIREELASCKYSTFHPDFRRTMHELEAYKSKKEYLKEEREREEKKLKERDQYFDDLKSRKIIELEWVTINDQSIMDSDGFYLSADLAEPITGVLTKTKVNTVAQKQFQDFVGKHGIEKFVEYNPHLFPLIQSYLNKRAELKDFKLYQTVDYGLGLSYKVLCARWYTKFTKDKMRYLRIEISKDADGNRWIAYRGAPSTNGVYDYSNAFSLDKYNRGNMKYVRYDDEGR